MSERDRRWTILEVLDWTRGHFEQRGLANPRLDAEVLLADVLELERVMLYARFDQPMEAEELARMRERVARRAAGTPVAHLTGRREFWSLSLEVNEDVLIPRPDTERLVEVVLARSDEPKTLVDVGTGSGAVAAALAQEYPDATVYALELSPPALATAQKNLARFGARIEVLEGSLLNPLPAGMTADVIAANLPYIPSSEIPSLQIEVQHEPHLALDGGDDGLSLIRALVAQTPRYLKRGGLLALESSSDQIAAVSTLLEEAGFSDVECAQDVAGLDRVTSGVWA